MDDPDVEDFLAQTQLDDDADEPEERLVSRELWLRFFSIHSKTVRSPETLRRLLAEIEGGKLATAAIAALRLESFTNAGIDPAVGLAELRRLPLECSEGARDLGALAFAELRGAQVQPNVALSWFAAPEEARGTGAGGDADASAQGLPPRADADLDLVCAICRLNAEEDMLLDELTLTPLAFAQKKMQGQIVAQQQTNFLSEFCNLNPQEQAQFWETARMRVDAELRMRRSSAGAAQREEHLSSREMWELMAGASRK